MPGKKLTFEQQIARLEEIVALLKQEIEEGTRDVSTGM